MPCTNPRSQQQQQQRCDAQRSSAATVFSNPLFLTEIDENVSRRVSPASLALSPQRGVMAFVVVWPGTGQERPHAAPAYRCTAVPAPRTTASTRKCKASITSCSPASGTGARGVAQAAVSLPASLPLHAEPRSAHSMWRVSDRTGADGTSVSDASTTMVGQHWAVEGTHSLDDYLKDDAARATTLARDVSISEAREESAVHDTTTSLTHTAPPVYAAGRLSGSDDGSNTTLCLAASKSTGEEREDGHTRADAPDEDPLQRSSTALSRLIARQDRSRLACALLPVHGALTMRDLPHPFLQGVHACWLSRAASVPDESRRLMDVASDERGGSLPSSIASFASLATVLNDDDPSPHESKDSPSISLSEGEEAPRAVPPSSHGFPLAAPLSSALASAWGSPEWQRQRSYARFERAVQGRSQPQEQRQQRWCGCGSASLSGGDVSSCGETCLSVPTPRNALWSPVQPPAWGGYTYRGSRVDEDATPLAAEAEGAVAAAAVLWAAERMCAIDDVCVVV